jgi:hypothetical protein
VSKLDTDVAVTSHAATPSEVKMAVFWVVTSCGLVEVERRFRGSYAFIIRAVFILATVIS